MSLEIISSLVRIRDMDELPWDLRVDEDGSVYLQWHGVGNPVTLRLGQLDPVYDKLTAFMATNDPRE